MKIIIRTLLILLLSVTFNVSFAQLVPYNYTEDFETGNNPVQPWAYTPGATYTVDSMVITDSDTSSGNYSLKMGVTLNGTGNPNEYCYYYWMIYLNPGPNLEDSLFFSMDVKMDSITSKNVQIGYNFNIIPATSGCLTIPADIPYDEWFTVSQPNVCTATYPDIKNMTDFLLYGGTPNDIGTQINIIGIFMSGYGVQHYSLYIDNIKLSGFVLDETVFQTNTANNWSAYIARIKDSVLVQRGIHDNITLLPDTAGLNLCASLRNIYKHLRADTLAMDSLLYYMDAQLADSLGFPASTMTELQYMFDDYNALLPLYTKAINTSGKLMVFNFPATRYIRLNGHNTPWTLLDTTNTYDVRMCSGEKKPTAFLLTPGCYNCPITIDCDDLISGTDTISKNAFDIYIAKFWYQGSIGETSEGKALMQELLLKDDSLVLVDDINGMNYLRVLDTITHIKSYADITTPTAILPSDIIVLDSAALQPFRMDSIRHKLIYVVINIPDNTPAGTYRSKLNFKDTSNNIINSFNINIEVLPFHLDSPRLEYSFYYEGKLTTDTIPSMTMEYKTKKQMLLELQDMKNHGVLHSTCAQPLASLGENLTLRNQAGLPRDKFYSEAFAATPAYLPYLEALAIQIKQWKDTLFVYGYDTTNLYLYGYDEASREILESEIPVWTATRNAGAKIYVAGYNYTFEIVDSLLNVFNYATGPLAPDAAQQVVNYHSVGSKIFSYACPAPWVENPEVYRRNSGCLLWQLGFDGSMEYAYQHNWGLFWNDFDTSIYGPGNELTFTYPTSDGIVQTIQWEGYREAINDVRYISTLLNMRDSLQLIGYDATDLNDWINNIDCDKDLEELRNEITDKILELSSVVVGINKMYETNYSLLYPNPTSGILTVSGISRETIATIYSVKGEVLQTCKLYLSENKINVSHLPNALYIIKLQTDKYITVKRFIKQ